MVTPAETNVGGRIVGRRGLIAGAAAMVTAIATRAGAGVAAASPVAPGGSDRDADTQRAGSALSPHYAAGTPDTIYQNIDGVNFNSSSNDNIFSNFGGGGIFSTALHSSFEARLNLPQGATITELVFSVLHNDVSNMSLGLRMFDASGNEMFPGVLGYFTQSSSVVSVSVPLNSPLPVVDNSHYT